MINYHPDTRLLNEYSSGTLPLAQSVCLSLHLNYCDQCRRSHQRLQQLGSALFEDLSPQQVDDSLLRTVMARLDEEPEPLQYQKTAANEDDCPPLIQRLMQGDYEDLEWKSISKKVHISRLRTGDVDNEFALYRIDAGASIPRHTHRGTELTLVLEGGFSDEEGHYEVGDFIMRDAQQQHSPTATRDRDCICIGVLDAPIKFTDWKYRPINPFLKLQAS
ncbi:ChrR family anti-sigma-E factor [Pseudohalioglobus lutimaris]|uniref:Transcriptional regulator n=1 Tax=Pseudohalioglobus lutimaris TaxID=1737061 RepID=A0A2N5X4B3_9GAMM|nr:ChrR family anti-sigma-E factor [Pseudohalioglobus lutimaris]PLW69310.1 transcriptional regulator [Pseudohalioglobus lutimaris]